MDRELSLSRFPLLGPDVDERPLACAPDPVFRGLFVAHLEVLDWSDLPAVSWITADKALYRELSGCPRWLVHALLLVGGSATALERRWR